MTDKFSEGMNEGLDQIMSPEMLTAFEIDRIRSNALGSGIERLGVAGVKLGYHYGYMAGYMAGLEKAGEVIKKRTGEQS